MSLPRFRVALGVFTAGYLIVRFQALADVGDNPEWMFEPVGALAWLREPFGRGVWVGLIVASVGSSLAFAGGRWARPLGASHAVLLLVVTTYHSSWGQILWYEILFLLHTVVLAGAAVLRVSDRTALNVAAVVTVTTYVIAGVAKLRIGGLGWMNGETLRNHVAYSAARLDVFGEKASPLGRLLVTHTGAFTPLAIGALAIELGAPLALARFRWAVVWCVAAWLMHVAIAASMFVVFIYPLTFLAFAPLLARTSSRP